MFGIKKTPCTYKEATNPELFKFDYPNHPEILKLSHQNINNYVKLAKNLKFRNKYEMFGFSVG